MSKKGFLVNELSYTILTDSSNTKTLTNNSVNLQILFDLQFQSV